MRTFIDFKEFRRVKQRVEYGENEVVVTLSRPQYDYIAFAIAMLTGEAGAKNTDTIKISGRGVTVFHAVNIAEIVKSHVVGLHQIAEIGTTVVKTEYEPIDRTKNPDNLTVERKVSTILITLSRNQLDKENPGYQEPIPADQVTPQEVSSPGEHRGRGGRRGGRGGRGGARGRRGGSTEVDRRDDRRQS